MKQSVVIEDNGVLINWWADEESPQEYFISFHALTSTSVSENPLTNTSINYSEVIGELLDLKWPEKETFYHIGQITVSKFPDNNINWLETFMSVEKHFYHEAIDQREMKKNPNKFLTDSAADLHDLVYEKLLRVVEENNKSEVENGLEQVAIEMMKKWNIIN